MTYCHECLGSAGLPPADLKVYPILSSLGEAKIDAMLEELVNSDLERTGQISPETFEAIDRAYNPEEFSHES